MAIGQRSVNGAFYRRPPCLGIPAIAAAAVPWCNADVDNMASVIRRLKAFRAKNTCFVKGASSRTSVR